MNARFGGIFHFLEPMCLQTLCDKFHGISESDVCLYHVRHGQVEKGNLIRHLRFRVGIWEELTVDGYPAGSGRY